MSGTQLFIGAPADVVMLRADAVADRLREDILNQVEPAGTTITESAVALRFSVARPTARQAIDKLVAYGLLQREAHHAARVPVLDRDDIIDLFDNRAVIEAAAMENLARTGDVPSEALAAHRALVASDEFARHDIDFHRALVGGQSSPRLARMHALLMGEIELCIAQVQAAQLLSSSAVARQHQAILDAIVAGDVPAASRLTRSHIVGARDVLLAHIDRTTN